MEPGSNCLFTPLDDNKYANKFLCAIFCLYVIYAPYIRDCVRAAPELGKITLLVAFIIKDRKCSFILKIYCTIMVKYFFQKSFVNIADYQVDSPTLNGLNTVHRSVRSLSNILDSPSLSVYIYT